MIYFKDGGVKIYINLTVVNMAKKGSQMTEGLFRKLASEETEEACPPAGVNRLLVVCRRVPSLTCSGVASYQDSVANPWYELWSRLNNTCLFELSDFLLRISKFSTIYFVIMLPHARSEVIHRSRRLAKFWNNILHHRFTKLFVGNSN